MNNRITVRTLVRVISFSMAAVFLAMGFLIQARYEAQRWRDTLQNSYAWAMGELSSNLAGISTDLDKLRYTAGPSQMARLSARILKQSASAKSALGTLPTGEVPLESTYRFLSQAGDFAITLSAKVIDGGDLSGEERDSALALGKTAVSLRDTVDDSLWKYRSGQIASQSMMAMDGGTNAVGAGFENLDETVTSYPTLIYDGPFSDHLLNRKPAMLENQPMLTQEEAAKIAANAAQVSRESLVPQEDENSNMASYVFQSGDITVGVTKRGGFISYLIDARTLGEERLRQDAIFSRASEFLQRIGLKDLHATYFEKAENICTINYAAQQGDVRLYPDLVKVGVALDDGSIVFYDARGYLMNHKERTLEATLGEQEARQALSELLTVSGSRLALIPTPGQGEVLTYEFRCKDSAREDVEALVYVNAQTGREENILMLVRTPGGTLTK